MDLSDLIMLDVREWRDLKLWIAERPPLCTTRVVKPREWVAPIVYHGESAAIRYKGMVVYHRIEAYQGDA